MNEAARQRSIFRHYPALAERLAFTELASLPTPITRQTALAQTVGIPELFVKSDDLSAADYGGNKIRKLEFLLADAQRKGCTTVLTFGGLGSNHALATSINCRRLGLKCIAILTPEPPTPAVRDTLSYHLLLGTQLEIAKRYADARAIADRISNSGQPDSIYEIPFGGSSWVGATGFVNAGLELSEQIAGGELAAPDVIYLACGTAGSAAGLAIGLQLAKLETRIEAVQVTPDSIHPEQLLKQLYMETTEQLARSDSSVKIDSPGLDNVSFRRDQLGEGYAIPTKEAGEAAELMSAYANIPASLTYTAKAMAALVADARAGKLANQKVLYWNTYNSRPYPDLTDYGDWRLLPQDLQPLFKG